MLPCPWIGLSCPLYQESFCDRQDSAQTCAFVQLANSSSLSGLSDRIAWLPARERSVLKRLLLGSERSEIARDLGVSPSSVDNLVSATRQRLGVSNQAELRRRFKHLAPLL